MSVPDVHPALGRRPIPRPRPAESDVTVHGLPAEKASETDGAVHPRAQLAWPEPGRSALGVRPSTEYWDVETASWRSREPLPRPGD
jgi:hypothetical protein